MVELTRLNGSKITINPYLVETIESNPDTTILMNSGKKYLVIESAGEIEKRFSNFLAGSFYKALVHSGAKVTTQNKEN
ncbi:MAG: flagellar FlbD family protein [Brevinema sp.]